jgi:hypothetical protein
LILSSFLLFPPSFHPSTAETLPPLSSTNQLIHRNELRFYADCDHISKYNSINKSSHPCIEVTCSIDIITLSLQNNKSNTPGNSNPYNRSITIGQPYRFLPILQLIKPHLALGKSSTSKIEEVIYTSRDLETNLHPCFVNSCN